MQIVAGSGAIVCQEQRSWVGFQYGASMLVQNNIDNQLHMEPHGAQGLGWQAFGAVLAMLKHVPIQRMVLFCKPFNLKPCIVLFVCNYTRVVHTHIRICYSEACLYENDGYMHSIDAILSRCQVHPIATTATGLNAEAARERGRHHVLLPQTRSAEMMSRDD